MRTKVLSMSCPVNELSTFLVFISSNHVVFTDIGQCNSAELTLRAKYFCI